MQRETRENMRNGISDMHADQVQLQHMQGFLPEAHQTLERELESNGVVMFQNSPSQNGGRTVPVHMKPQLGSNHHRGLEKPLHGRRVQI